MLSHICMWVLDAFDIGLPLQRRGAIILKMQRGTKAAHVEVDGDTVHWFIYHENHLDCFVQT